MSDFCRKCPLDPVKSLGEGSCPFTSLYWSFLERSEARLANVPRMTTPLATMRRKSAAERAAFRARSNAIVNLERGDIVL